jgi:AbrB family looped-hinge helix DNA binding protein
MTNHGMITIPSKIRKKLGFKDGKKFMVIEEEGSV